MAFEIGTFGKGNSGNGSGNLTKFIKQKLFEVNNLPIQNEDNQESINNKFNTQLTNINAYLVDFQERVRGVYISLTQLNTAIPDPRVNDIAIVSDTNTLYYCRILNQWSSMGISQEMTDLINTLKGGVSSDGDTLKKLYDLIQVNKNSIISIQDDIININSEIGDFFSTIADIDNIINKKDEIVSFLSGIPESENLLSILLSNSTNDRNRANHTGSQDISTIINLQTSLNNKVDIETGKGLSTNDYTTAEKTKLAGIQDGAEVNIKANWNETDNTQDSFILNKPDLSLKEDKLNKATDFSIINDTKYPTTEAVKEQLDLKQNITDNNLNTINKTITGAINENKTNIDNKQNLIPKIISEAEMLALTNLTVGYIVNRSDKSALFQLKTLPSNQLQNWDVIVSTGASVSIPSTAVEKIYTSGALPTIDGYYAYNGGTMPTGTIGDILKLESSVWTIDQTFENAPASIYSKFDGKTYNKKINSSGIKTWAVAIEPSYYEVKSTGDNTKQGGFTSLQNAVDNFTSSLSSIGTCKIYDSALNESVDINAVNFHIEGDGTQSRSQTQISKITLNSNSHRITLKNILLGGASNQTPLVIQSSGTLTENGTANVGKGKHILSGVSFSTTGTTAVDVISLNNFLIVDSCDCGNRIIQLRDRIGTPILVSFVNCQNGVLIAGNGYVINKFNSPSLIVSSVGASSYLLDLDISRPVAYSLIRKSSALGDTIPIALGTLIINDDVGGNLSNLKCKTAYNVAANLGVGTAIDLTKYDIQASGGASIDDTTLSTSKVYSSQKVDDTYIKKPTSVIENNIAIFDINKNTIDGNKKFKDTLIGSEDDIEKQTIILNQKQTEDKLILKEDKITKTGQAKKFLKVNETEDGYIFEELLDSNNLIKSSYLSKDLTFEFISVANETERFALTTNEVQKNDAVFQIDTNKLYYVIDILNLNQANGYKEVAINFTLSSKQNTIQTKVNNQTEMLALTGIVENDIVIRIDKLNSLYRFKGGTISDVANWEIIGADPTSANFIKYSIIKEQTKTSTFSVPQDLIIFNDVDGFNYGEFLVCKTAYVVPITASTGTNLDITKYELFRNNKIYNITAKGNTNELYFAFNRVNSLASNKEDYVFNLKGYFSGETLPITLLNSITRATFNGINSNETIIPANITIAHNNQFTFDNISFTGNLTLNVALNSKIIFKNCKFSNLAINSADNPANIEYHNCEFISNIDFVSFLPVNSLKIKFYNCLIPSSLNILQRQSGGGASTTRRFDYYFDVETSRRSAFIFNAYGYPVFNAVVFDLGTSDVYNCFLKRAKQTQFIGEFKDFDKDVASIYTNLLLADGGTFSSTSYPYLYQYYGNSNVKISDTRGQFPRYKNNSRADGKQDPGGERALGNYQADEFKDHNHIQTLGQGINTGKRWKDNGYYYGQSYSNWLASLPYYDTLCLTENSGGNETRGKNVCLNRYIVAGYNFE